MFYIGIDIGKRHHEAGLINDKGDHVGKTIRFANSKDGSQKLLQFINQYKLTPDNSVVGLEAIGHYWLSIFSFLHKLGFKSTVFNARRVVSRLFVLDCEMALSQSFWVSFIKRNCVCVFQFFFIRLLAFFNSAISYSYNRGHGLN